MDNSSCNLKTQDLKQGTTDQIDSRFNQTLCNAQGSVKGRNFPGRVLISRLDPMALHSLAVGLSLGPSENNTSSSKHSDGTIEDQIHTSKLYDSATAEELQSSPSNPDDTVKEASRFAISPRATDIARLMKFTKVLGDVSVTLDKLRDLAWNGVPSYIRPNVWRLLLGYAPANSDRREGVLRRKRTEYFDYVAQYYNISDNERTDEEVNILRQIAVDCPRTVPEVTFFQQVEVQKCLEQILYTWAIRHPASGYVQGINELVTPFLVVFLSEHLEGSVDKWLIADLDHDTISNVEADCYWCLSKLLDGMQDHYTFAQPGIQRLVYKLKELVGRIDVFLQEMIDSWSAPFVEAFKDSEKVQLYEVSVIESWLLSLTPIKTLLLGMLKKSRPSVAETDNTCFWRPLLLQKGAENTKPVNRSKFQWDPEHETKVKENWEGILKARFRDLMREVRQDAIKLATKSGAKK